MNDTYFDTSEFKDILKKYEVAHEQGDPVFFDSDDLTDIAEYYHAKGDERRAEETIDYAISLFPGAVAPLAFRARLLLTQGGSPQEALAYAEQIEDRSDPDYSYIMAEIMIVEGRAEEADAYLRDACEVLDGEDKADFILDVATLYADYDMLDLAQQWLKQSDEPHLADYKELQGRIALGKGNYEESESIFNQLIDEDPYSTPYWNHLATTQFMNNHINESIASSEFSIAINPNDDEAILNKANALYCLGNYEEALRYYQRFSTLCPAEDSGDIFQGVTLLNLNRYEEAVACFKEAERKGYPHSPNLSETYQELAFTLSHLQRLDEALAYVEKAATLPSADQSEMLVLKGHLLLEHGRSDEANACFQKAMLQSDNSPHIFLRISISIYDCGYLHLAYKMLKALLSAGIDDWQQGYAYLAACCREMGKQDEYLLNLKKACTLNPTEARTVLGEFFPPELPADAYYQYAVEHQP